MGSKETRFGVQYFSDLHLEMMPSFQQPVPVVGEVLVLAGDIGNIRQPLTRDFLAQMCLQFKDVVYVTGNHEYYQAQYKGEEWSMRETDAETERYCAGLANMHFLNKKSWTHPSGLVTFHGCTLWSNVPPESVELVCLCLNDYQYIMLNDDTASATSAERKLRKYTVSDSNQLFADHFAWLKGAVESSTSRHNIVVTHHMPTQQLIAEQYKEHPANSAFATNLDEFIISHPQIRAWLCGHSHTVGKVKVGNTECSLYPIGYSYEAPGKTYITTLYLPRM